MRTLAALLFAASMPAVAGGSYTPAELSALVSAGKHPAQGPASTQTQALDFAACVARVNAMVAQVSPPYPSKVIVSNALLKTVKVWTNDAAMTITCSQPDAKLILTTAKYQ